MQTAATAKRDQSNTKKSLQGPTLFEIEYLRQMKEELEIFLRSKNFNTIQAIEIAFVGDGYDGLMRVS